MFIEMMLSKIHRATVTDANLNYVGSVTIDSELLKLSGMLPGQKVQIVNNNNGARFETYIIEGEANSGIICINGAAARLAEPGDIVILLTYGYLTLEEAKALKPAVLFVDENNKPVHSDNRDSTRA